MNKIVLIILMITSLNASSQSLFDSLSNTRFTFEDSLGPALVELAMKNPNLRLLDKQTEGTKYAWQLAKVGLIPNLTASFNLNEANIKNASTTDPTRQNVFYPRYNLSLSIPLTQFFSRNKESKVKLASYEESQIKKEAEVNNLKEEVLVTYTNYKLNRYLVALQETAVQDETIVFGQVEQKFTKNTVSLETYTLASKRLNDALSKKLTLVRDLQVSKYNLENLIGMKFEAALAIIGKTPGKKIR